MKRFLNFGLMIAMLLGLAGFVSPVAAQANTPQTYTVWVGAENVKKAVNIMTFFPSTLRVHVGDSVLWKLNSHEIHTVTFLAGGQLPDLIIPAPANQPSPVMINPQVGFPIAPANGMYDGSTYANSGVLSMDPGQPQTFQLTFTKAGTFEYLCVVHGTMMSGKIEVVDPSVRIPSPGKVASQAKEQIENAWDHLPNIRRAVNKELQRPVRNPDGTMTHHVLVGFSVGVYDFMRFFPSTLAVRPGDTVVWDLSKEDVAPHTISFLNGTGDNGLVLPVPQPQGPPLLLFNPAVLFPSPNVIAGQPITRQGYFNSGLLDPINGPTSFTSKIGDVKGLIPYLCQLHDESGMKGNLFVVPRK